MKRKAFITGISGQDGSYLTEFLLNKNYEVHGLVRRASTYARGRLEHLYPKHKEKNLFLYYGDMSDKGSISKILHDINPDEVYNLAAQSHVKISFDMPEYTAEVVGFDALRLLECLRAMRSKAKYYQASSSEMFGNSSDTFLHEKSHFHPCSPYACAKVFAHHASINYRESYGMFTSNGILFNHESPRRGENFVTRKITLGLADILAKKSKKIYLGNLDSKRDWGYAKDYVEAMWLMLQQKNPDDYVIATGEAHSVKEFLTEAFSLVGLGWRKYVVSDPKHFRPADINCLLGDASKAKEKLGWKPKTNFKQLVKIMVKADCADRGISV